MACQWVGAGVSHRLNEADETSRPRGTGASAWRKKWAIYWATYRTTQTAEFVCRHASGSEFAIKLRGTDMSVDNGLMLAMCIQRLSPQLSDVVPVGQSFHQTLRDWHASKTIAMAWHQHCVILCYLQRLKPEMSTVVPVVGFVIKFRGTGASADQMALCQLSVILCYLQRLKPEMSTDVPVGRVCHQIPRDWCVGWPNGPTPT